MSQPAAADRRLNGAASDDPRLALTDYRLFCMDGLGQFMGAEMIQAAHDQEAVEIAREMDLSIKCEVWDGQRLVERIERQAPA